MKHLYLGAAYDALRKIVGQKADDFYINIKPTAGYSKFVHGPAFTTYGQKVTIANYEELDRIRMGIYRDHQDYFRHMNPIVCLQANDNKVAHTGDITSLIYKKMGAQGMLTDGITRDADIIDDIGFPVFSKDNNPIDAIGHWALTKYDCEIKIEGVTINSGDYIAMDRDGAIVVPKELLGFYWGKFYTIIEKERSIRSQIMMDKPLDDILSDNGRW